MSSNNYLRDGRAGKKKFCNKYKLMLTVAGQWIQFLWYEFATRLCPFIWRDGWGVLLFKLWELQAWYRSIRIAWNHVQGCTFRTGHVVVIRCFFEATNAALDEIALLITTAEPPLVGLSLNLFVFVCPLFTLESYPLSESTEGMVSCCEERKGKDKKDW